MMINNASKLSWHKVTLNINIFVCSQSVLMTNQWAYSSNSNDTYLPQSIPYNVHCIGKWSKGMSCVKMT